ncbi:MAG: glucose-6-phosphate isomerase [Bacteroidetes bacterium]|nr:glucose-6-phosphate isomerase [Bacteroidota bacterium]
MVTFTFHLQSLQPKVDEAVKFFAQHSVVERFWKKDYTIWRSEEEHKKSILNRLGWQTSIQLMKENIGTLLAFANEIKNAGFTHVVVLGMGGSSLSPDVSRTVFGSAPGFPKMLVLDSTNPTSVLRIENSISPAETLFIVASKSGGTLETNVFYQYFYDRVGKVKKNPGDNFIAITDANTKMERIAVEKKFRKIFLNPADIGGRYSALSYFGIVPMALIGMDIEKILASAEQIQTLSKSELSSNKAFHLGLAMGEAFRAGRDKLTFITSDEIAPFSFWMEQLIAESTGKEGKGIVPIEGEQFQRQNYFADQFFIFLQLKKDEEKYLSCKKELEQKIIPYSVVELDSVYDLGSQYFLWEIATAVSAIVMKINPFDEPNVKESKDNTERVIGNYVSSGTLPVNYEILQEKEFILYGEPSYASQIKKSTIAETIIKHCVGEKGKDYVALLAYIDQDEQNNEHLSKLREIITKKTGLPVTVGFGPRYLHSTGQLHKGGASNGIFIIITANELRDAAIPGERYSFGILKTAQALGDYQSLVQKNRRLIHLHISTNANSGLQLLIKTIQ